VFKHYLDLKLIYFELQVIEKLLYSKEMQ